MNNYLDMSVYRRRPLVPVKRAADIYAWRRSRAKEEAAFAFGVIGAVAFLITLYGLWMVFG